MKKQRLNCLETMSLSREYLCNFMETYPIAFFPPSCDRNPASLLNSAMVCFVTG